MSNLGVVARGKFVGKMADFIWEGAGIFGAIAVWEGKHLLTRICGFFELPLHLVINQLLAGLSNSPLEKEISNNV